ncbi:MAG: hypothetical protein DBX56_00930 [Coriobacteriia bacterium]|nr:zinc ribbon domain-containing protein [Slackia sp.]PWM49980.1 MAG: hypothetical protein DBX56_00930 [Coriobacteriia bacterium]
MYCSHCGAENKNAAQYCRNCGNALNASSYPDGAPSAFEQEIAASKGRQSVAQFLRAFQTHVAPQAKNYNELGVHCAQMETLERQRADFERRMKSPALLVVGCVLTALGIGLIVSFVSYMQEHASEVSIIENPTFADYVDNIVALLFLGSPLIIGAILIAIFFIQKTRAPKNREKIESQYAQAKSAAQTAANEIWRNYESFANHQLVAFKYANPWLLDALARIVADGKADTLTQAIQYFENECYQQEMKGIANANLYATQEVLEQTKSIQRQLAYIGATSTIGAIGAWRK